MAEGAIGSIGFGIAGLIVGGMDQVDTTRRIEIGFSHWRMILLFVLCLGCGVGTAVILFYWDVIRVELSGLIVGQLVSVTLFILKLIMIWGLFCFVALSAGVGRLMLFDRGPVVTISPEGISDSRFQSIEIPWDSIRSIVQKRTMGTKNFLLTLDQDVFKAVTSKEHWLSTLCRWLLFSRRTEGDFSVSISPDALQIADDDFLSLVSAYAHAYGRITK